MFIAPLCSLGAPEGQRNKDLAPVLWPATPSCDCWLGAAYCLGSPFCCASRSWGALAEVLGWGCFVLLWFPLPGCSEYSVGKWLWRAGPAAHLLLGGREEQGPPASALQRAWSRCFCSLLYPAQALILLCCQNTFAGEALILSAVSAAAERVCTWSCRSVFPPGCDRLGQQWGCWSHGRVCSRLLIFALGLGQHDLSEVCWLCSTLSCMFWDSSVFQPWVWGRRLG